MITTVKIRLIHKAAIPHSRWCEPIGWEPANVIEGCEYDNGLWWDGDDEAAGLVWFGHPDEYGTNEMIEANVDDIRVAKSGSNCRVIGELIL